MRFLKDRQGRLEFQRSTLKVTNEFYGRYEAISKILDDTPRILDLVRRDLEKVLEEEERKASALQGRPCRFTTESVLRTLVCFVVEGVSLREIVVRVDDSYSLREFVRIYDGPMMDYSTLCKLKNAIRPETWKKVNQALAKSAVQAELIDGAKLRLDTTLVETNIRWPSDSGLLWDVYRVVARLIRKARRLDGGIAGNKRLLDKKVKRFHVSIGREAGKHNPRDDRMKRLYKVLIGLAEAILATAVAVVRGLEEAMQAGRYDARSTRDAKEIIDQLKHYEQLGRRVVDQSRRRVLKGEQVPATEKVYSIFEPHTELIKRGKAGKPIEFGHMVLLDQVEGKFITDYEVFEQRPTEHELVEPAVKAHAKLFGKPPAELAADRAFHHSSTVACLEQEIELVAIGKQHHKTDQDVAREKDVLFKLAQAFRAGIEGSISFLKRALRMFRCFDKGWEHFAAAIGRIVFGHNLVVLARVSAA